MNQPDLHHVGVRDVEFGARVKIVEPCNLYGCRVGLEHNARIEQREERVEVTVAGGGEKSIDNFALSGEVTNGSCSRTLHPAACAARELPCHSRGAPHDGSDLVEGYGE